MFASMHAFQTCLTISLTNRMKLAAAEASMRISILLALAYLPCVSHATTVLKCVDAAGNVNFTQTACPPGQHLDSISELTAPPPSGDGDPVKLAEPKAPVPVTQAAPAPAQPPIVIVAPTPAPEAQGEIYESYRGYQRHVPYRHDYYPPPPGHWGKPPGSWPPPPPPPPPRPPAEPDKPRIKGMLMDR